MMKAFLVSPSGYSGPKQLRNALGILDSWGFEAKYLPGITSRYHYYAGDYQRRTNELNGAYRDPDSDVIFCIIGGMGAVQTLPYIDYAAIRWSDKIPVGYSDVTILLNAIYILTGKKCFHGPTLKKPLDKWDKKTVSSLLGGLEGKRLKVNFRKEDVFREGFTERQIVGGNINLLGRSLGTEYEIDTKGKILFLEEVGMRGHWVFDILWQLKLAGKFESVKRIILGYFTNYWTILPIAERICRPT